MTDATHEGADDQSIHERLTAYLGAEDEPEEQPDAQADETPESEAASQDETPAEDDPTDDAQEETEEQQIELSAIAQLLGVEENSLEVDEDGTVSFKTKIDGQEGKAKLAGLIKSHQLEGHLNKKTMEVAERDKQLQAQRQELEKEYQQRINYADTLNKLAFEDLQGQYARIDWDKLRAENPVEYTLLRQEFSDRHTQIMQRAQAVQNEQAKLTQQQQAKFSEVLQAEATALKSAMKWTDDAATKKGIGEIADYLKGAGITDEELGTIVSHRAWIIANKAMLYDRLQAGKAGVQKKVAAAPKLSKTGARITGDKSAKLDGIKKQIRSGRNGSVAQYLLEAGKV